MLIKLIQVQRGIRGGAPTLSEIYVNPSHIISISEDTPAATSLMKEAQQLGLVEGAKFSSVTISEGHQSRVLMVVGSAVDIHKQLKKKQVLRG